jgi:hypothetical protein
MDNGAKRPLALRWIISEFTEAIYLFEGPKGEKRGG